MTTRIKICGITNSQDALMAVSLGADALGFVFSKSPRQVTPEEADKIIRLVPPFVNCVGVFANESRRRILEVLDSCALDSIQLHGDETPLFCLELKEFNKTVLKAIRVRDASSLENLEEYPVDGFYFDTYSNETLGGTGKTFNWELIEGKVFKKPIILSGGLLAENVTQAIQRLHPYGVDASSRLEKEPGKKDPIKMRAFIEAVKKTDQK